MAYSLENMSEEQKQRIEKLYRKFRKNVAVAGLLYFGSMFLTNFLITLIDKIFLNDPGLAFFACMLNSFIHVMGFQGTREEYLTELSEDVAVILDGVQ
jgi:hypothetical protein